MKKHVTHDRLAIPTGIILGLSLAQSAIRSHCLEPVDLDKGILPEGYEGFRTIARTEFKAEEVLFVDSNVPKGILSAGLVEVEEAAPVSAKQKPKPKEENPEAKAKAAADKLAADGAKKEAAAEKKAAATKKKEAAAEKKAAAKKKEGAK